MALGHGKYPANATASSANGAAIATASRRAPLLCGGVRGIDGFHRIAEHDAQRFVRAMRAELHRRHRGAEHLRGFGEREAVLFDELERDALRFRNARELFLNEARR